MVDIGLWTKMFLKRQHAQIVKGKPSGLKSNSRTRKTDITFSRYSICVFEKTVFRNVLGGNFQGFASFSFIHRLNLKGGWPKRMAKLGPPIFILKSIFERTDKTTIFIN